MSPLLCPNEGELTKYCLGSLPVERIDEVANHLDDCTSCSDRLTDLFQKSDPLAEAVRRAGQVQAYSATVAPPATLRDYRVEGVLGEGGMGTVYRAMHTRLGRPVALKLLTASRRLDPDASARFEREMRAIGALRHPNIVHATDAGEVDGVPFLVMELLDGRDLGRLVSERGTMSVPGACEVIRQAALGLQHAHDHGLVHRDVKPSNLMLTADGTVKLLDLGLARNATTLENPGSAFDTTVAGMSDLTDPNTRVGTERYMAPEQRTSPELVGPQADIYALGRTLCFVLHGTPDLPSVGTVPAGLHSILQRMQAENPAERFASASAVALALEPWCPKNKVELLPMHGRQKARLGLAIACLLIVGTGITIAIMRLPRKEATPQPDVIPAPAVVKKDPPPGGVLGMSADEAAIVQKQWADFLEQAPTIENTIGMKLALVPPGELNLTLATRVQITRPYWLGVTEVTQAQFRKFVNETGHRTDVEINGNGQFLVYVQMAKNSGGTRGRRDPKYSWQNPGYAPVSDDHPVTQVSWNDAAAFCRWLGREEGKTYRLPTAAESQWAARAGEPGNYPGNHPDGDLLRSLDLVAWTSTTSPQHPRPVGTLRPNAWALFDMLGNVQEWVFDWWGEPATAVHPDYQGPVEGKLRVVCGGAYTKRPSYGDQAALAPDCGNSSIGFRVVREP